MVLPGSLGHVYMAVVPGIGSLATAWLPTIPSFVRMVPVDYQPSAADMNISAPVTSRWGPGRQPGGPGDVIEVMALRLLSASLPHAIAGESWAIAGHSSGGTIVYRCMELIVDLLERPRSAAQSIGQAAGQWLPAAEAARLRKLLENLSGKTLNKPLVAISLEGSLLPCDVDGWASDLANPQSLAAAQLAGHEQIKECTLAAALQERCGGERPPRHLLSIRRWLELPDGPPFAYMAGTLSDARTRFVFPALQGIATESGAPSSKLEIQMVVHSGHEMFEDNPEAVKQNFENMLGSRLGSSTGRLMILDPVLRHHANAAVQIVGIMVLCLFVRSVACFVRILHCGPGARNHERPLLQESE